jgi:hypothetical protein
MTKATSSTSSPITLKDLVKFIWYNASTGELFSLSKHEPHHPERKLIPDETNKINSTLLGHRLKIKADRLAWFIATGKQPSRHQIIFHRNMDDLDNSLHNLVLLQKKEYQQLVEAMKNISGDLRMIPHSTDMFSYVLIFKHNGRSHREVVQDITVARRKFTRLQLKFVKVISRYTISD